MKRPLISVVVPVFNCEKYIRTCLDSVLDQTFQDYEIIIVDDGSTDNSQNICLKYVTKYPERVEYSYQANKGPAAARNCGIRLARGKYVSLLDADDYWDNRFLEIMLKELQSSESDIVVCYNYRLEFENNCLLKEEIEMTCAKIATSTDLYKEFLREDLIGGPARMLCKKAILDDIGGYDETFWIIDCWDIWIRFFEKERRVSIVRLPLYYYHVRDDGSNITRRANIWDKLHEIYLIYRKFKDSIHQDPELKEVYSEYFWNCALSLYRERTNFVWVIYFVFLSQRLHFSILGKTLRFLQRNNSSS